jgi:Zn-dependent protease with chaperone function
MVSALRAAISVAMLAGFYVVALVQLVAAVAFAFWVGSHAGAAVAVKVVLPLLIALVGGVGVALWRAVRAKPEPPKGLQVGPHQAPALWSTVHALAGEARTRMPDEIRLVPEVNAAVVEESRLLGLVGGRRYLYIGLPLLQTMRVDELCSVLAHELGHYSGNHTRLGAIAYRGRLAIGGTIRQIGPLNPVGWVFKAYALLYVVIDNAVVRRQEYEADLASVRVAGREVAAGALRGLPALDAAWDFFLGRYVLPGWEAGYAPDDLFGGFAALVAARRHELMELRQAEPPSEGSVWDTHPPLADRIKAILAMPERPARYDGRPAATLVTDIAGAGYALQRLMVDIGDRQVMPWDRFTAATATFHLQREADTIFRTASRVTRGQVRELGAVLRTLESNRHLPIAEALFPSATRREAGQQFAEPLESLMRLAAIRSGVAGWQHSWSGRPELVRRGGAPLGLDEVAKLALSPGSLAEAYRRLGDLGIDVTKATLVEQTASAVGADVVGAIANTKVNGTDYDLLILDQGFVLVGGPGRKEEGKQRLVQVISSASATELARKHWFLPYEEIATVTLDRETPVRATLVLHDGRRFEMQESWTGEMITKQSRDVLLQLLKALNRA